MNKKGSKSILSDNNKEKLLRSLIVEFDENHNLKSKISYKDIYEYVKYSLEDKNNEFYPSYTWWKTKGKHLVDEYNIVRKKTVRLTENEQLDVVDMLDLVEKHYGDKAALIKYLLPYNELVDRLVDKTNEFQNIIQKLTIKLDEKDNAIQRNESTIKKQEALIDGLFYTHVGSARELKRIMQLGETTSQSLNCSLTETFGSPTAYLEEFRDRANINYESTNKEKNNLIQIQRKNNTLPDEDEYNW